MAADTTKLTIELQTILRGLNQTLRGLDQIKRKLDAVAGVKLNQRASTTSVDRQALATQKLALQQQRLQLQQQKLAVQTQDLANKQERARQTTERLALSQQRLEQAQQRVTTGITNTGRAAITLDQTLGRVGGALRNLGLGLTSLGSSLTVALTAPLTAIGVLATRNAVTLDSLKRGLVAITGSADEAGRQLSRLTQIAKLPGIGFQEAIQGSIRLQAVGFSAEKAEKALIQFSNAVALTGGGREELARITVQLGQLSAKGKVLAQDLKPIIEAGPAVGRALLEAFGTVNSEDIQALGLSSEEFLDRLVKQLGQLPRAAAGLRNTFDNFSDAVFRASAAIGEAILPVLTQLIQVAEPIITKLAAAFKELPPVVQTVIVVFGGLTAAVGPALFILGQFATGIGGLISAFGRLHALGLLPTIKGFQLLGQVMRGTASLAAGQVATTVAAAAGWAALGGAILGVIAVAGGIAFLLSEQREAIKISKEQIEATENQITSLKDQIKFLDELKTGVERTADEQSRLAQIYADLNAQAKVRVTAITDEEKRLAALREELQRLLRLRNEERIQQAANLAASLANTAQQLQSGQQERDSIATRVQANVRLAQAIAETGRITGEQSKQLARQGINAATAQEAIGALNAENESLIGSQGKLIDTSKELNGTAEEQGEALRVLQQQTGLSARELLSAAKAMGVFKGDIETTLPLIERFISTQQRAAESTDAFTRALAQQSQELLRAGDAAGTARKTRKALIDAAVDLAKEASTSFDGALKFLRAFIAAQPELRASIEKERQLTGKSFDEFITEALREGATKSGTQLRDAQQRLSNALLQVKEAVSEKQIAEQKAANERLLEENELSFARQLTAYRAYLERRAELTDENLAKEHFAQLVIAKDAREAQQRLLGAALKSGIPETEQVKRRAQAAEFEEKALKAETKAAEIEAQRAKVAGDLKRVLAEANIQQIRDVRQLDIEFAELQGNIEAALNARTVERFREQLQLLSLAQDDLNKKLQQARKSGDTGKQKEIEDALRLNQSQIDLIELITQQELATNKLAAANEFVRRAKEQQSALEQELAFQVEFRGLKEEDAIRARLAGEQRLADSLRVVRDLVQQEIDLLNAKGVKPPQVLLDFIRETSATIKGLGELPFSEQFRLAEKEFNRLNDERLDKIADIQRAIQERDIAEAEGLLFIRRINGQYSEDLERQLALLKQIAAQSNDVNLQRQAASAQQTVKDVTTELAGLDEQIRSISIDALQDGFTEFFQSLTDRTKTAKEKLLDLVNSVANRINQVIAENLSRRLVESLFGGGTGDQGVFARLFGRSGEGQQGGIGAVAGASQVGVQTTATAAATTLATGVATAAATFSTGVTTAGVSFGTTVITTATSFAATVLAAAAGFAAAVAASVAAQGISSGLGSLGSSINAAATGIFPAIPGGVVRIVEGGYPEAVLTTDPKHAARQVAILRAFLKETKGLGGRIRGLAAGGFTDRIDISAPSVQLSNSGIGELAVAGASSTMHIRQILVDERDLGNWINSSEGERVLVDFLNKKQHVIRKLSGG